MGSRPQPEDGPGRERANRRVLAGVVCAGTFVGATRPTQAQTPAGPVAPPAGALVDTTIVLGRQDSTSYPTPAYCLAAVRATETLAHRAATDSTGYHYNPEDTVATTTSAIARRCSSSFAVDAVAPAELLDLAHLALATRDDAKAQAAVGRYVAGASDAAARRERLYDADTLYFHARPRRWALADSMTARLDALGPPAALQRKRMHDELYMDAQARYDVARLQRELPALLTVCGQLSAAAQEQGEVVCTPEMWALDLFVVELYQSPGQVTPALERTGRLVTAAGFQRWPAFRQALQTNAYTRPTLEQIGKPAPPLVAQHWVGPKGRAPGWPVKGKVSILLRMEELGNPHDMAMWKQLGEKYKDVLDLTILLSTRGYFRDGPPLSPAEEAQRVGRYYHEQLGVPATMAVLETPVTQLPPPDGRVLLGEPPLAKDPYYGNGAFLLTDRTGKVFLAGMVGRSGSEAMLDAWIARAAGR